MNVLIGANVVFDVVRSRQTHPVLGRSSGLSGYVCNITDLDLSKFSLLPVGKRIFIRTVQQING